MAEKQIQQALSMLSLDLYVLLLLSVRQSQYLLNNSIYAILLVNKLAIICF